MLTRGPLATYTNPKDSPYSFQKSNFSGVTYSLTLKCLSVGCMIKEIWVLQHLQRRQGSINYKQ